MFLRKNEVAPVCGMCRLGGVSMLCCCLLFSLQSGFNQDYTNLLWHRVNVPLLHTGPNGWNERSLSSPSAETLKAFKKQLKTHFFY